MRRFFLLLACGLLAASPPSASAQLLSKSDLFADLIFLTDAAEARAPATPALVVDTVREHVSRGSRGAVQFQSDTSPLPDSITPFQYRIAVGSALQAIRDGHALVLKNPLARADSFYFPLPVALLGDKLVLLRQCPEYPADLVGGEVVRINGVPTGEILDNLFRYAAADGGGTHFAEALVRVNPIAFLTAYFGAPRRYQIEVISSLTLRAGLRGERAMEVEAIRTIRAGVPRYPLLGLVSSAALHRGNNALHLRASDSTAILSVTTFSKKDKAFFRKAFSRMEAAGTHRLVLDLRGNTGGHRSAAVALTRHLVREPFGYSLVRPRDQDMLPYLNRQGRMFYALGRVKYTLAAPFRSARTPMGHSVRYRYKPVKNPFAGKLAVITDGLTFSSATMVASWLELQRRATFVGSQAGGGYNGNWGGSFPRITLPKSGMVIQLPAYRLVLDETSKRGDGIMPDEEVRYTVEDMLAGHDADLEAAVEVLKGPRTLAPGD